MMKTQLIATKGPRLWQGIPGIERSPSGRLWCTFFSGGPREPDPANRILLTTSPDGRHWADPAPIVDPPGPTRAYDPALWLDPDDRLWLFYNLANLSEHAYSLWALRTDDPDPASPAWSAPIRIAIDAPFCFRLNKPTVLTSGAWVLPVTWAQVPEGWFAHDEQLQGVAISHDKGETWSLHGAVKAPPWALENMIIQLRDGALWMLIRTGSGVLWQAHSNDDGLTWSEPSPTGIVNPGTRFFIRRLACGRLLLINTPNPHERRSLYAYLSQAGNDYRFARRILLDARDSVSYPDAVEGPPGILHAVHDRDRQGVGEIILDVFSVEEILQQPDLGRDAIEVIPAKESL
jgi:predicted neuraminidase